MTWKSFDEIYEHIGRFCVDFEQYCRSMEACIRTILHSKGLTDESIQAILLSGHTAEPLRSLLQKLIGEMLVNEDNKKLYSKAFARLQSIINERNDLIHAKWFMYGDLDKVSNKADFLAVGEKLHANKDGADIKDFTLEKSKLDALIQECRDAGIIVSLLTRCVLGIRDIKDCFDIKNGELVIKYEELKPDVKSV